MFLSIETLIPISLQIDFPQFPWILQLRRQQSLRRLRRGYLLVAPPLRRVVVAVDFELYLVAAVWQVAYRIPSTKDCVDAAVAADLDLYPIAVLPHASATIYFAIDPPKRALAPKKKRKLKRKFASSKKEIRLMPNYF